MKHITVALYLPSPFVLSAVEYTLSRTREFTSTIVNIERNTDNKWHCSGKSRPTVFIGDALHTPESLLEEVCNRWKAISIGIITGPIHSTRLKEFDRTIGLYESPHSIISLISSSLAASSDDKTDPTRKELSPREKEIVIGIVKGLSNKEIADKIHLSVNTVITHRRNISAKLQIHSTAGLTIYAIVSNLISLDEAEKHT